MKKRLMKCWQPAILALFIIIFITFQITLLDRPFYWDEAWSYASGVEAMNKHGPSLMPGAIDSYLYRGHPTFFYFITAIWMKVFGPSLVSIHSFFLLISISLVVVVYMLGKFVSGKNVGLLASMCLLAIPLFIAQAGFMLPEVMLALFSILTVYFYFKKKVLLEIVFGTLLLYTKETGIVLILSILLFDLAQHIVISKNMKYSLKGISSFFVHLLPLLFVSVFYIIQKIKLGWFLYPGHIDMMSFDYPVIKDKIIRILKYMLKKEGRYFILIVFALSGCIYLFQKNKKKLELQFLLFSMLFISAYIVFSALNFYTVRYTMSLFPFLFITVTIVLASLLEKYPVVLFIMVALFNGLSLKHSFKPEGVGDHTIGFLKMAGAYQETITFCEEMNLHNREIGTSFNLIFYFKQPFIGYLSANSKFLKVNSYKDSKLEFAVISSIELSEQALAIQKSENFKLIKRFGQNTAYCELYQKKNSTYMLPPEKLDSR